MNHLGLVQVGSVIYLSGIICFAVSINENRDPKRIMRETGRRWIKFLGLTIIIALATHLLSLS